MSMSVFGAARRRRRGWRDAQAVGDAKAAAEIGERAAAHVELELTRLHHIGAVVAMEAKLAHRDAERNGADRARRQADLLEGLELAHRPRLARHEIADIELHRLLGGSVADVAHLDADFQ